MGYNSFNKVLSPLLTKKLYNSHLYSYLKDQELTRDFKVDNLIEKENKKASIE